MCDLALPRSANAGGRSVDLGPDCVRFANRKTALDPFDLVERNPNRDMKTVVAIRAAHHLGMFV